jgi:hypothetical protein
MFEVEEDEDNRGPVVGGSSDVHVANGDHEDGGAGEEPVEIGLEAVELLLDTLQRRVQPCLATKAKDCLCETHVATYRDGQRSVLEDAIETLEMMLPAEEGEGEK